MTDHCSFCGSPLHYGKGSNNGSCAVCSIVTCIRCTTYAFCRPHFQALSPRGQSTVKKVYRASWIVPLCLIIFTYYLGTGPLYGILIPPLWFLGMLVFIGVPIWKKGAWLKAIWRRDTALAEQPFTPWKCPACGFENPPITQACGQCGWNKSTSLRIA